MAGSHASWLPLMGMALTLGGCVDMFTTAPPEAVRWRGVTTAGAKGEPNCGPFAMDLGVYSDPVFLMEVASGRAYPTVRVTQDDLATWWLEGYATAGNFVEFESREQRPVILDARPYAVWRGTRGDERIVLVESGSPCGREVVLTRG